MHKEAEQPPVIAYGGAVFKCNGRGSASVPTAVVKAKCKQYFKTVIIDEVRTSSVCPQCDGLLSKVLSKVTTPTRQVRGLMRCGSESCRNVRFKNRDAVGAQNILRCATSRDRPGCLERIPGAPALSLSNWRMRAD